MSDVGGGAIFLWAEIITWGENLHQRDSRVRGVGDVVGGRVVAAPGAKLRRHTFGDGASPFSWLRGSLLSCLLGVTFHVAKEDIAAGISADHWL
jgi:hypothetical protein